MNFSKNSFFNTNFCVTFRYLSKLQTKSRILNLTLFRYLIITFIPRVSVSDMEPDILFSLLNYKEYKHNQEINRARLSYYFIVSQLFFLITFTRRLYDWKWFANETKKPTSLAHMSHNSLIVSIYNIHNKNVTIE